MIYRRWFWGTALGVFGAVLMLAGAAWLVDPIELWEAPVICGFNHIKPKQAVLLDVWKPFQVRRRMPEVIYIGTSRVYVGFRPEENAYNMGGSGLSLPDMRAYLRFIYSQHVPKKVYIGLDFFQFGHEYMTMKREGFSNERLMILERGNIFPLLEAWKTSLGMVKYLPETVKSSFENQNKPREWEQGYDVRRGETTEIERRTYYATLHGNYGIYSRFVFDSEAILCLREILQEAANNGVEVVLFFNPISVDLLALQSICGREDFFRNIKRDVAALHPVYDFAWASSLALDRENVWFDGGHYNRPTGDRMKASMADNVDAEICRVLTADNVEMHLQEEAARYKQWEEENKAYIQVLSEAAPQKIPEGALKPYLGF